MNLKKISAAIAVASAVATGSMFAAGTANASSIEADASGSVYTFNYDLTISTDLPSAGDGA